MGDPRSKIAKQIREEGMRRWQAQQHPQGAPFKRPMRLLRPAGQLFDQPNSTLGLFYNVSVDRPSGATAQRSAYTAAKFELESWCF